LRTASPPNFFIKFLTSITARHPSLENRKQFCQSDRKAEIDRRTRQKRKPCVVRSVADIVAGFLQIDDRDKTRDRRFFDERDKLARIRRNDDAEGLRHNDFNKRLPPRKTERTPRFRLPRIDPLNACAEDLRTVGAGIDAEGNDRDEHRIAYTDRREDYKIKNHQLRRHRYAAYDRRINFGNLLQHFVF